MKKFAVPLMMLVMALSLTACGGGSSESESGGDGGDSTGAGVSAGYETYDDFTMWDDFYNLDTDEQIYFNYPNWWYEEVPGGYGISDDVNQYEIIAIANYEEVYDGEIENILDTAYAEFVDAAGDVLTAYYDPAELDLSLLTEREVVDLPCGVQALKWGGTLPADISGKDPYPVYGYSFVYQNMNVTMAYVLEPDCLDAEDKVKDVVDRMVTTVRSTEE